MLAGQSRGKPSTEFSDCLTCPIDRSQFDNGVGFTRYRWCIDRERFDQGQRAASALQIHITGNAKGPVILANHGALSISSHAAVEAGCGVLSGDLSETFLGSDVFLRGMGGVGWLRSLSRLGFAWRVASLAIE